jgi:hypothetical protein
MNADGFTAATWKAVRVFTGRLATPEDVDADRAVFALGDTMDPQVFEEPLPQPVLWYEDESDVAQAALIVQAESHETEDGERLEVLGLLLPDGRTVVAFTEDVEEVDGDDADWLDLVEVQSAGGLDGVDSANDNDADPS